MTVIDITSKHSKAIDDGAAAVSPTPESDVPARRRVHISRFLITLATLALAGALGSAAWGAYMGAPWTRDATVRAYVVTMAPEVAGRIVELPVADNQYVRKGDLLMTIDPTNYTIAASQAEAAVQQAHASIDNIDAQIGVQQAQINASRRSWIGPAQRSCSRNNKPRDIRPWRRMAMAACRMLSNSHPSCISRRPRCRPQCKTSPSRNGRLGRSRRNA